MWSMWTKFYPKKLSCCSQEKETHPPLQKFRIASHDTQIEILFHFITFEGGSCVLCSCPSSGSEWGLGQNINWDLGKEKVRKETELIMDQRRGPISDLYNCCWLAQSLIFYIKYSQPNTSSVYLHNCPELIFRTLTFFTLILHEDDI